MAVLSAPSSGVAVSAVLPRMLTIHLNKMPLLAGLSEEALENVARVLLVRTANRKHAVVHKGGAGEHLLFLLSGRMQAVDITADGREIGLSFLSPGDFFGELSVIDGLPRSASVVACEACTYALLPRTEALNLIYKHPVVAERVFKRLAAGIRQSSNFRNILGISNAFQRVYALLDHLSLVGPGGLVVIERLPTQQEISIMANTSRETVSRAFQALIQRGVIEKDAKRLIVRQPAALRDELKVSRLSAV